MRTTIDLFAGAGGASLGLRNAGFHHELCVEWDEDAASTLMAAGFPGIRGDVRELEHYADVKKVDMLWASPPCQAFSTAGKRQGALDDRNGWPWTLDIIDHLSSRGIGPEWVICENVLGLTYHKGDCDRTEVMGCAGCYWDGWVKPEFRKRFDWVGAVVLNAADFGVPQFRRRVFLVAGPRAVKWPAPTHCSPEKSGQQTMFGPAMKQWSSIGHALGIDSRVIGIASNPYTKDEDGEWDKSSRTYKDITDEPSTGITAKGPLWNQGPFVVEDEPGSEPWRLDRPSHAVMTTEVKGTRGKHIKGRPDRASDSLWLSTGRRRLTWQECAVLQGFPGDYPFEGRTKAAIYKQVGNAVCPVISEVLGRCVMKAMTDM